MRKTVNKQGVRVADTSMKPTLHICGNCLYAVFDENAKQYNVKAEQYSCHYHPPRGQLVPMQGQTGMQMVNASSRGIVQHTDVACHSFLARADVPPKLAS